MPEICSGGVGVFCVGWAWSKGLLLRSKMGRKERRRDMVC